MTMAGRPPNAPQTVGLGLGVQPGAQRAVIAQWVIIFGAGGGLFIYDGTPALGNPPVFSVVAPGVSSDPYGNMVVAVVEAGADGSNYLRITSAGDLETYSGGLLVQVLSPTQGAFFAYNNVNGAGAGQLLAAIAPGTTADSYGNVIEPGVWVPGGSPGTPGGVQVHNGQLFFLYSTSQAGPWATVSSSVPGPTSTLLQGFQVQANAPGGTVAETWHPLTLAAGWSNVTGYAPASYRLNALGNVEMAGRITGTISGNTTVGTLLTGYYSATYARAYPANVDSAAGGITPSETPHLHCTTSGVVYVTGLNNGTATVDLDGTFMLSRG